MKSIRHHIFFILAVSFFACVSCGREEAEVIPRNTLAKIYAEMFVTDQWVTSSPGIRQIADTSLVYEPILEKYGYTSDDYRRSVDVYMDDPERFARILRSTAELLDARLRELRKLQKSLKTEEELEAERQRLLEAVRSDFKPEEFFPYMFDEPYVHYYDSVAFEPDSLLQIYRLLPLERADTLYDRLVMIIRDTVAAAYSISVADSVAVTDSVAAEDSPAFSDTLEKKDSVRPDGMRKTSRRFGEKGRILK